MSLVTVHPYISLPSPTWTVPKFKKNIFVCLTCRLQSDQVCLYFRALYARKMAAVSVDAVLFSVCPVPARLDAVAHAVERVETGHYFDSVN